MKPQLELVFELNGVLEPAVVIGETPHGTRRMVPIKGGTFEGANIRGNLLPGGADWQAVRADGAAELHALYLLETDDGVRIQVENHGLSCGVWPPASRSIRPSTTFAPLRGFPRPRANTSG